MHLALEEFDGVEHTNTTKYNSAGRVDVSETMVTGLTGSTALPSKPAARNPARTRATVRREIPNSSTRRARVGTEVLVATAPLHYEAPHLPTGCSQ